jgi:hypothetical protein
MMRRYESHCITKTRRTRGSVLFLLAGPSWRVVLCSFFAMKVLLHLLQQQQQQQKKEKKEKEKEKRTLAFRFVGQLCT